MAEVIAAGNSSKCNVVLGLQQCAYHTVEINEQQI